MVWLIADDPSGLLSSIKIGMSAKQEKPILSYTVDMMAIYRKNILVSKVSKFRYSIIVASLSAGQASIDFEQSSIMTIMIMIL